MGIMRDIPKVVLALKDTVIVTCSTDDVYVTTGALQVDASCAAASTGGIAGHVIDRLSPDLGAMFTQVSAHGFLRTYLGSTQADNKLTLQVLIEHGASSCGGDMDGLSTETAGAVATFFTSAGTTPMHCWSTKAVNWKAANVSYADLLPAKRFIRCVVYTSKSQVVTSSGEFEHYAVGAVLAFQGADVLDFKANTSGPGSTSTSTST